MSRRLVLPLCAALAAGTALSGLGAAPAQAAGACTLLAPATARVVQPEATYVIKATGPCTVGTGHALWDLNSPDGYETFVRIEGRPTATWTLYDTIALGISTWKPSFAWDSNSNDLAQNVPRMDVRVGSWAAVSSGRSAGRTTINATVTRYATTLDRNIGWAGATGVIQYRTPGTSTWRSLKNVTANSAGRYSYTYTTSQVRDYRVAIFSRSTIWWAHSGVTRR